MYALASRNDATHVLSALIGRADDCWGGQQCPQFHSVSAAAVSLAVSAAVPWALSTVDVTVQPLRNSASHALGANDVRSAPAAVTLHAVPVRCGVVKIPIASAGNGDAFAVTITASGAGARSSPRDGARSRDARAGGQAPDARAGPSGGQLRRLRRPVTGVSRSLVVVCVRVRVRAVLIGVRRYAGDDQPGGSLRELRQRRAWRRRRGHGSSEPPARTGSPHRRAAAARACRRPAAAGWSRVRRRRRRPRPPGGTRSGAGTRGARLSADRASPRRRTRSSPRRPGGGRCPRPGRRCWRPRAEASLSGGRPGLRPCRRGTR